MNLVLKHIVTSYQNHNVRRGKMWYHFSGTISWQEVQEDVQEPEDV